MAMSRLLTTAIFLSIVVLPEAFIPSASNGRCAIGHHIVLSAKSSQRSNNNDDEPNYLLDEFRTYRGELVDPYQILKVKRTAERSDIKSSYRNLSRRYHPDCVRHRDILPGSCNNLDDVRDHWEKVKLSYEILSDTRRRKRYDRHEALADPGRAVRRAATGAAVSGVANIGKGIGKGLFSMGAFAVNQLQKRSNDSKGEAL